MLDALRLLAVVLMLLAHTARITATKARPWWGEPSLDLEPLCQGLFLCLVGVSLAYSWDVARYRGAAPRRWLLARGRRAGELMALSVLFFLVERGPSWPHWLTSTGILAIIAAAMVLFAPLVLLRRPLAWSAVCTLALWAIALALDHRDLEILGLNAGNGPLLPTAVYAGVGLTGLLLVRRFGRRGFGALLLLGILGAGAVLWGAPGHSLHEALDSDWSRSHHTIELWGRSHGLANAWAMLRGQELRILRARFFNPRPHLVPLVSAMVIALYLALHPARRWLARVGPWGLAIGRYALGVYVLHLGLVALPVLITGRMHALTETWQSNAWLLLSALACQGYASFRHWQALRRRRAREREAS